MTHKQSRKTQRALERALFGPEPSAPRKKKRERKLVAPEPPRVQKPGDCPHCGNICDLAPGHTFFCDDCGTHYDEWNRYGKKAEA